MAIGISVSINSSTSTRSALTLSIAGVQVNPTYGPTAQDGTTLSAEVSHETDPNPAVTYQWCTEDGPIAGATDLDFTVDAALYDGQALHCQVTPQDPQLGPMLTSANYIVRHAPPVLAMPLDDMVFDLDTGTQQIDLNGVFTGNDIDYTATPSPAAYNSNLGVLEIETDLTIIGAEITLTAFNSGGSVSTTFEITVEVEPIEDVTYYFPAFTAAGDAAVPVSGTTITSGDTSGHWQIVDQMLSPTAAGDATDLDQTPYVLVLDTGQTVTVEITQQIGANQWALSGPRADGFDLVVFEVPAGVEALQISLNGSPFADLASNTPGTYFIGGLEPETAYRVELRGFAGAGGPPSLKSIFTVPVDPRGFRGWNAAINLGTGGDLFVAPYGDDTNDGLTAATPLRTITAANAAATSGDTIKIRAGLYREQVDPIAGVTLEGYGTEKPILTAAEPLMGFVRCDVADVDILGGEHINHSAGQCPIFKTTLNKADIAHEDILALNIFDGSERMFPATDRADVSNLFDDLDPKSYHKASNLSVDVDDKILSITDPNIVTSARYTAEQLLASDVLLYHSPNVVSRVKVTAVDLAQNTLFVDGLKGLQTNGDDVDTYALTNVAPALTPGTYYIKDNGTDVDIYIFPLNANQIDMLEYSSRRNVIRLSAGIDNVRLRGLQVTRASGSATAGGVNIIKSDLGSLTSGHVIEHVLSTDVYNPTKKARSIRLTRTQNTKIENCSFYNLMNGMGIFLNGGSITKDANGVVIDRKPGINNLVSQCHFDKIAGTGPGFFQQFNLVVAHNYISRCGTAAHSNKSTAYEQCHNVLWWANEFASNVRGYLTWQEASAVTVAWNVIPIFSSDQSDRRAIVDQTNSTVPPEATSFGYIFNNAVYPQLGSNAPGVAVSLSNSNINQSITLVNNIFDSVTAPVRAIPPYDAFASNIITNLGYDGVNQIASEFPEGNTVQTDLTAVYEDASEGYFVPRPNSPIITIPGQDITNIMAELQLTYPFFTGFDRDYKNQFIDYDRLPVGPDSALAFDRVPRLSNAQASIDSPTRALGAVTTSLSGGTLYAGLWSDTFTPTEADIISATNATYHQVRSAPQNGVQTFDATDLTPEQTLIWHFVHVRSEGSAQLASDPFTLGAPATGTNLMPDPGFDDPAKWSLATGFDLTAGTLHIQAAATNFSATATHGAFPVLVGELITYEIAVDVVSVTNGERLRIIVQELSQGASLGTTIPFDTNSAGALIAGTRINFQFTTQAGTDALKISFNKLSSLEAVFDNISCIEIS